MPLCLTGGKNLTAKRLIIPGNISRTQKWFIPCVCPANMSMYPFWDWVYFVLKYFSIFIRFKPCFSQIFHNILTVEPIQFRKYCMNVINHCKYGRCRRFWLAIWIWAACSICRACMCVCTCVFVFLLCISMADDISTSTCVRTSVKNVRGSERS